MTTPDPALPGPIPAAALKAPPAVLPPVASDRLSMAKPGRSSYRRALDALVRDRAAILGFVLFLVIVTAAVLAPHIVPHPPNAISMKVKLQGPTSQHLLGTDELGRDVLSRLIYGARVSMLIGLGSVTLAAAAGVVLGLIGAFFGGVIDTVVMRSMDGLLAFPALILALAIVTVLGPSLFNLMVAIGVVSIPSFARILRASVLTLKEREFVEATRACGAGNLYL